METYDLQIYQGETFSYSFTATDRSGTTMNLSGQTVSGYLKTKYSDSGKLANLNATVTDAAAGTINLSLAATGTAALPVNYAFYDVEVHNTTGNTTVRTLAGKALIYPEATW